MNTGTGEVIAAKVVVDGEGEGVGVFLFCVERRFAQAGLLSQSANQMYCKL